MSERLTKDQLDAFKVGMRQNDQNGSGVIATSDIPTVIAALGYTIPESEIASILYELDPDESGVVNMNSFFGMVSEKLASHTTLEQVKMLFNSMDRNGHGYISVDELRFITQAIGVNVTDSEIKLMVETLDIDGDGKVNFDEFATLFKHI
ncbi:calmodulin-alpha-like [Teleopsis dalmanni]|uniref:calmodulin-alpha-like n=1 Tax=Teleopsis dalmanni TaxID=139649 RepID=UPI0018CFB14B|nr:calmodulin-alpha-like [Teleopsis dalmanni]